MKKFLPLFLSITLLLAAAPLVLAENGPATITLSGKTQPVVTFNHGTHQAKNADCTTCHHMGVGNGSCKGCHSRDGRFADVKTAMHNSCNGCHVKQGIASADNCGFCHVAAAPTTSDSTSGRTRGDSSTRTWKRR